MGQRYGHLIKSLIRIVKFKGSSKKSFGGYGKIGYKSSKKLGKWFVGLFHEYGTKYMAAREPLKNSWEAIRGEVNLIKITDKGIAEGLERAAQKAG